MYCLPDRDPARKLFVMGLTGAICDFINSTTVCKNFVKGRRILHVGRLLFCGRIGK